MDISLDIEAIKECTEEKKEEKIMQLLDVWDPFVNNAMREIVRIFDAIVSAPQDDDRMCISLETEKMLTECFRHVVREIFEKGDMAVIPELDDKAEDDDDENASNGENA